MNLAEQMLLQRWADERDAEAFAEIVKRYAGLVYGTCRRVLRNEKEAEDVAQECFVKLAQVRRTTIGSLGGWLHTVATREALNRVKADRRRTARETAYASAQPHHVEITWDDLQDWVDEALEALPEELREPVIRHFLQGETHDAIARDVQASRSTVTRRIAQGIEEIRSILRMRGVAVPAAALSAGMAVHMAEAAPGSLRAALGRYALAGGEKVGKGARGARGFDKPAAGPAGGKAALVAAVVLLTVSFVAWWRATDARPGDQTSPPTAASVARLDAPLLNAAVGPDPAAVEVVEARAAGFRAPADVKVVITDETEKVGLRCVDPTGAAVPGAEVYLLHIESLSDAMTYPASPADRRVEALGPAITDEEGWAHFEAVPRFITKYGNRGAYARVPGVWAGIWQQSARARPGGEPINEVPMAPVVDIGGVVQLPAGAAPGDVVVEVLTLSRRGLGSGHTVFSNDYLSSQRLWPDVFQTVPDEQGRFVIADMPDDATVHVSANARGLANTQFMGGGLKGHVVTLTMELGGIVEGRVVREANSKPVAGIPVLVQAEQARAVRIPHMVQTDSAGAYRVAGLAPGLHSIRVLVGNQPSQFNARPVQVDVVVGEPVQAPPLVLERGGLVSGTIRDAKVGTPVEGATVVALYPAAVEGVAIGSATAGKDGAFQVRLPAGEYMFYFFDVTDGYVYPEDQGKRTVLVPPMQQAVTGVNLVLTPNKAEPEKIEFATIEGVVVDKEGNPLEGAVIIDYEARMMGGHESFVTAPLGQSDAAGRFSFHVRAGVPHEISAGGRAFTSLRSESFTPDAGQTYDMGSFLIDRLYGLFTGTVVDEEGAPLPNAELHVSSCEASWSSGSATTGADGRFTIDAAPENDVMYLQIRKDGYGKGYFQTFRDVPSGEDRVYVLKREE
jgi:RNA polymerase sigma factor (sigma-70 family)